MFDELLQDFFMLFLLLEGSSDHVDEDDEDSNDGGETGECVIFGGIKGRQISTESFIN